MNITAFIDKTSTFEWVIIGLFIICFIVQLVYYLYLFRKPYMHAATNNDETLEEKELPGISIIITAKDEAENLRRNLSFVLNQDYPNLQVVVVNNASTDTTADVLEDYRKSYPNLYVTFIPIGSNVINNKKLALTVGIKAAKHDILLFTEPDTKPLSNKWVYEYAKAFNKEKDIVLGCCQIDIDKSFFKKYILYDNLFSGVKYISMALANKPYMGVGRNMAFRKNLFFDNKGFSTLLNIRDGEDNIFINRRATKENTAVISSTQSMVTSSAADSIKSWRNIKTRYLTTRKNYNGNRAKLINFEEFSRYIFYILFATLLIIGTAYSSKLIALFSLTLFFIRYIIQVIVTNKNSKVYNAGSFYFSLPLLDLIIPIANHLFIRRDTEKE